MGTVTLRRTLLLWQLPFLALLLLAWGLVNQSLGSRVQATARATELRMHSETLAGVLGAVVDMETGVRGYVLAGREDFLDPYRAGRTALAARLTRLRTLSVQMQGAQTPDAAQALRDIDRIEELALRWQTEVAEPEIAARRAGQADEARLLVTTGRGKRLVDAIRERVARYGEREQTRLAAQEAQARRELSRLRSLLLGLGAALLLFSVGAALFTSRRLSGRLEELGGAAERLASGERDVRLEVGGWSELRGLSLAFNRMSTELEQAQAEAVVRARDLTHRNVQMRALGELSDWMQAARSLSEGAEVLARALPALLPGTQGTLHLHNASRNLLAPLVSWGGAAAASPSAPDACWALRRGEARFPGEGRFAPPCAAVLGGANGECGQESREYVCFPLFSHGETLGTLRLSAAPEAGEAGLLADREELRQLLVPLTRQVGLALAALRLQERLLAQSLLAQSLRDPLTGLSNRRHLEQELEAHSLQATVAGTPLALLALDVDHFKRLNDTFGHDAGDAVLVRLGAALRSLTPPGGLAARPGGEEFALLLPGLTEAEAAEVAERIRAEVASWTLTHTGIPLGQITVSQGLASWGGERPERRNPGQARRRGPLPRQAGGTQPREPFRRGEPGSAFRVRGRCRKPDCERWAG